MALFLFAAASPAAADTLAFRDDFEAGPNWSIFEEIVGGSVLYGSGIGEVSRDTALPYRGVRNLRVWAGKLRGDSSNHVIAQRRIDDAPAAGQVHMEVFTRIDTPLSWGQTGPEFSIQSTAMVGDTWLTSIAGLQYLCWSDSWQIWDSGTWRTFLTLPLQRDTWYYIGLRADFASLRYQRLWLRGGGIDTAIDVSAFQIKRENKFFTDTALWLTLESENVWSNNQYDSDFPVVYDDLRYYRVSLPVSNLMIPSGTSASVAPPIGSSETFVQVSFSGGETTAGALAAAAAAGTGVDYSLACRLLDPRDTVTIDLWTREVAPSIFVGLRSDTASLGGMPAGIPDDDTGRRAFGATVLLTEFSGTSGLLLGDTRTTTALADSFAYNLVYDLSETTARRFASLGFDTSPGASGWAFWYADTYGGSWIRDTTVTVALAAGAGGGIRVRVAGITKDLPGGLGATPGNVETASDGGRCLFERAGVFRRGLLPCLRAIRDLLLSSALGRLAISIL